MKYWKKKIGVFLLCMVLFVSNQTFLTSFASEKTDYEAEADAEDITESNETVSDTLITEEETGTATGSESGGVFLNSIS